MSTTISKYAWTSICGATRFTREEADQRAKQYGGKVERMYLNTFVVKKSDGVYLRLIER